MTGKREAAGGKRAALAVLALAFGLAPVWGASKDAGTTGAAFLKIAAGARPAALGDSFTALADDVHAVTWNPAGLARVTQPQFTVSRAQWLQEYDHSYMAGAHPFSWGTVGFGFTSLSVDGIEKRAGDTDDADSTFGAADSAYTISYGTSLGDAWSAGLGVTYVRQELDGHAGTALAASAGAMWKTPHQPLTLSLAVRNAGSDVTFEEEGDPLPMTVSAGFGYSLMNDRLRLGLDARRPLEGGTPVSLGAEYVQPVSQTVSAAFRGGYDTLSDGPVDGLSGVSAGLGLTWKSWGFDMTWAPYGSLGQTFRYSFLAKF